MSLPSNARGRESVSAWIGRALRSRRTANRTSGLKGCPPDEVGRIARDVGLTPGELIRLATMGPNAADEVYRRLEELDVDADEVRHRDPALLRELIKVCSFCTTKARCSSDLNWCPLAPDWSHYCPNATILESLGTRLPRAQK